MSPMASMLVSASWWAMVDHQSLTRQYKVAGVSTGEYVWLWGLAVAFSLSLAGAAVVLPKWFVRRFGGRADLCTEADHHRLPGWFAFSNKVVGLLLAPPLLTLLWVLTWMWVDVCRGVQGSPGTVPIRYQDLRLFFGPAFSLGCMIAIASRIALVVDSVWEAKSDAGQPQETMPGVSRIGVMSGALLVLPTLVIVIVMCWDMSLAWIIGIRPRSGLSGMTNAMYRMIGTLGPANFIGSVLLLYAGNQWLQRWCHHVRTRGKAIEQRAIKPSLLLFAKIDAAVGVALICPALLILGVSAWTTFRRSFGRFTDRDFRRLLSADMLSLLGPCIVAGCVLLVCSSVAWWFARSAALKVVEKDQSQRVPRLVKIGAVVGAMLLSPVPAILLAMGWETLQERYYPATHLARVDSSAMYTLEEASDLFGGAVAVGVLFILLSAAGYIVSGLLHLFCRKPAARMAQSFDDL